MSNYNATGNATKTKNTHTRQPDDEDSSSVPVDPGPESTVTSFDQKDNSSPIVKSLEWGCVNVQTFGSFKDVKLYPGGAEAWDWEKTGTHHQPGILPADVLELLEHGCEILILSRGMKKMLYTSDKTLQLLEKKQMEVNKDYFIAQSEEAVKLYNEYVKKRKRVGALIHSTC